MSSQELNPDGQVGPVGVCLGRVDLFCDGSPFPPDSGPISKEQMWRWPTFALDRLRQAGLMQNVVDKFKENGVILTTDYSGVGTPETALSFILVALKRMGFDLARTNTGERAVRFASAGDLSAHCRKILLNHEGDLKPECHLIGQLRV